MKMLSNATIACQPGPYCCCSSNGRSLMRVPSGKRLLGKRMPGCRCCCCPGCSVGCCCCCEGAEACCASGACFDCPCFGSSGFASFADWPDCEPSVPTMKQFIPAVSGLADLHKARLAMSARRPASALQTSVNAEPKRCYRQPHKQPSMFC